MLHAHYVIIYLLHSTSFISKAFLTTKMIELGIVSPSCYSLVAQNCNIWALFSLISKKDNFRHSASKDKKAYHQKFVQNSDLDWFQYFNQNEGFYKKICNVWTTKSNLMKICQINVLCQQILPFSKNNNFFCLTIKNCFC